MTPAKAKIKCLPEMTFVSRNSAVVDVCRRVFTTSKGTAIPCEKEAQMPPAKKYLNFIEKNKKLHLTSKHHAGQGSPRIHFTLNKVQSLEEEL